eukprot:CAMPEP_0177187072 /NCGR_PEP_ID=MMETSP0367-20130122/18996_1 /TAXON_ID=447022 ORGANISM="Scrippsiella hangoei-like, Strain SHHI-4" /NCGR_SAMPLE_ID=MMETSP0367 /ASSEMBLY_ACC=CAM_ASM_000362 /LENGTH=56 /DNA_ID=CAMNT_0018634431 /DNA_START=8 /DNA_END=178 /DNA_ORIENTATION=+
MPRRRGLTKCDDAEAPGTVYSDVLCAQKGEMRRLNSCRSIALSSWTPGEPKIAEFS